MRAAILFSRAFLWVLALSGLFLAFAPSAVLAAEESKDATAKETQTSPKGTTSAQDDESAEPATPPPGLFAPDFCDFQITFPEKPAVTEKCLPDSSCFNLNSYTMVYDLQTTVDISVNCTPSTPANKARYKENVMRIALESMARQKGLKDYQIQYDTINGVKNAVLTGLAKRGTQDEIFVSQLWIGDNSVFTVQAELIGTAHSVADKSFHDILSTIQFKKGGQIPVTPKPAMKTNR